MAKWQNSIRIKSDKHSYRNGTISLQEFAKRIAGRVSNVRSGLDDDLIYERDEIAYDFMVLSKDQTADVEEFDDILERLYDWADTSLDNNWNGKKIAWIESF